MPCCRTLEPLELLLLCINHDPMCLPQKPRMVLIPFEHGPSQTMTFWGNFLYALIAPLLFASAQLGAQTRSFCILYTPSMPKNFTSEKRICMVCFLWKFRSNLICKPFSLSSMSINEERFDYLFVWRVSKTVF